MAIGGDLKATPSQQVVTVASFSFLPNDVERTRVEVSDEEGPLVASDWSEPGEKRETVRLLGMPASSTLTARLVTEGGEELDSVEFETGAPPPQVPVLTVTGEPGWAGYNFTSVIGTENVALVLDERGRVIWYHVSEDEVVLSRTRLRPDNEGITYLMAPGGAGKPQYLADVDWDSAEEARFAEISTSPTTSSSAPTGESPHSSPRRSWWPARRSAAARSWSSRRMAPARRCGSARTPGRPA